MSTAIGFVGVGRMGSRFARRFSDNGYVVHAYDPDPAALASLEQKPVTLATSLSELLTHVHVVVLSLPAPDVLTAVAREIADSVESGDITVVDTSTCGLDATRTAARTLTTAGVGFLDAPVSGGISRAADGTLAVMVGGAPDLYFEHEAILRAIGSNLFHVGPDPGQGQVMKLANNILSHGALAATAEATTVTNKAGIPLETAIAVLNAGSGRNSATQDKFPRSVLTGSFDFGWPLAGSVKDTALFQQSADSLGVPTVVGQAIVNAWQQAVDDGWGEHDFTAIAHFYAEQAQKEGGSA